MLTEDAQRFADQMGIQLYETSAKDNINVEQVIKLYLLFSYIKIILLSNDYKNNIDKMY